LVVIQGDELPEHIEPELTLSGQQHLVIELDELLPPALVDRVDPNLDHRHRLGLLHRWLHGRRQGSPERGAPLKQQPDAPR
jgi:hypothetical protein